VYPPIAFQRDGDIWVANDDGSGESNVTQSPADEANPDWLPAGWSWTYSPEGGAPAGPWLAFESDQGAGGNCG
jgi:hypothetical protein